MSAMMQEFLEKAAPPVLFLYGAKSLFQNKAAAVVGTHFPTEPGLLADELKRSVSELSGALRRDDDALRDAARTALRRAINKRLRKRPSVEVHLLRV